MNEIQQYVIIVPSMDDKQNLGFFLISLAKKIMSMLIAC